VRKLKSLAKALPKFRADVCSVERYGGQVVFFEPMAKFENRGFVRQDIDR